MADIAQKFGASSGPLYGAQAPKHVTGRYYPPQFYIASTGANLSTTATRFYIMPYLITEIRSYDGFMATNASTGDTGELCRLGLYNDDGELVQAGAEITFGSTAIDNESAGTFTPAYLGWHFIVGHFNSATVMKRLVPQGQEVTAAGYRMPGILSAFFGTLSGALDDASAQPGAYYLDTTYAALPSTLPTPTSMTNVAPYICLKA